MANYLDKYKKKYRVVAAYDHSTNDYPRHDDGSLDPSGGDVFIKCKNGNYIYHYGRNVLVAVYLTKGRGRNAIKWLYEKLYGEIPSNFSYEDILKKLLQETLFKVEETDEEFFIYFKDKNFDLIAKHICPSSFGAGMSPYSSRNLPKTAYKIPEEDNTLYKEATQTISKDNMLIIAHASKKFIEYISSKKMSVNDIKADMKKQGLNGRNYFHANGYWSQYIDFLNKYIKENI